MRRLLLVVTAVGGGALTLWAAAAAVGVRSPLVAFLAVWIPMACFSLVGGPVTARMPERVFALRPWERRGRVYELLGVRVAKRLLRRGPLHVFAPSIRLPADPTPESLARLAGRMRQAETVHGVMAVATLPVAGYAAARGWWSSAAWVVAVDVVVNGYPAMLQRDNRARLEERWPSLRPGHPAGPSDRSGHPDARGRARETGL